MISSSPINVTSTTTMHDQLFIRDEQGKEHCLQLSDSQLRVRPGHRVTAVWAIKSGKNHGPYVAIINHVLNDIDYVDGGLKKLFGVGEHHVFFILMSIIFTVTSLAIDARVGFTLAWVMLGVGTIAVLFRRIRRERALIQAIKSQVAPSIAMPL